MKIETKKGISAADWAHLTEWKERVFPEEGRGKQWSSVSWHSIAYSEGGDPVGHIGFDRFDIVVDSECLSVIGVGGVVVRPEYQGRRIPALLFDKVHNEGGDNLGLDVFILFCPARLVPYYEKHGYRQHMGPVNFLQYGEQVQSTFEFMHRGLASANSVELRCAPW